MLIEKNIPPFLNIVQLHDDCETSSHILHSEPEKHVHFTISDNVLTENPI